MTVRTLALFVLLSSLALCLFAGVAHAGEDPSVPVTAAADGTWDMFVKDGPLWGGLLIIAGLLRTFVSKQHWIAQGKVLSGLTGLSMVLGAIVLWHFADAPPASILTALLAAYTLMTHSTVPGAVPKDAPKAVATTGGEA